MTIKHLACFGICLFFATLAFAKKIVWDFGPAELPRPNTHENFCAEFKPEQSNFGCDGVPANLTQEANRLFAEVNKLNENHQNFCKDYPNVSTPLQPQFFDQKDIKEKTCGGKSCPAAYASINETPIEVRASNTAVLGSGTTGCTRRVFASLSEYVRMGQDIQLRFSSSYQSLLQEYEKGLEKMKPKPNQALQEKLAQALSETGTEITDKKKEIAESTQAFESQIKDCVEDCDNSDKDDDHDSPKNDNSSADSLAAMTAMNGMSSNMGNLAGLANKNNGGDNSNSNVPTPDKKDPKDHSSKTPPLGGSPTPESQKLTQGGGPRPNTSGPCGLFGATFQPFGAGEAPKPGERIVRSPTGVQGHCVTATTTPPGSGDEGAGEFGGLVGNSNGKEEKKAELPKALEVQKKPEEKKETSNSFAMNETVSSPKAADTSIQQPKEKKPEEKKEHKVAGFDPQLEVPVLPEPSRRTASTNSSSSAGGSTSKEETLPFPDVEESSDPNFKGGFQDFELTRFVSGVKDKTICPEGYKEEEATRPACVI